MLGATGLTVGGGVLGARAGLSGPPSGSAFGPRAAALLNGWMALAVVVAVAAPGAVAARWWRDPVVRRALVPYLGVLAAQIATESVAPRRLPGWTALISGSLYTSFRLWQLRTARVDLQAAPPHAGRRAARAAVTAGSAFWTLNLAVLAASARPLTRQ